MLQILLSTAIRQGDKTGGRRVLGVAVGGRLRKRPEKKGPEKKDKYIY